VGEDVEDALDQKEQDGTRTETGEPNEVLDVEREETLEVEQRRTKAGSAQQGLKVS